MEHDEKKILGFADQMQNIKAQISREIIGQEDIISQLLMAMVAGGNVLLEGVRGWARRAWYAR